ncbi:AAA family ATPase [Pseudolysinimonas sp.]|uniref:AAA family ATPase n=1 Tax=Pseudolysinimonas sp. TaxID=2680009 RepID=UPI003F822131
MDFDQPPVLSVVPNGRDREAGPGWPKTVPAVEQLLRDGLALARGVTLLVGQNGSGKSTVLEAVAMAYGLSPEGGSVHAQHRTRPTESPLSGWIELRRGLGAGRWGFFLRAETMHGFYTYLEQNPGVRDPRFHEMSHGESFLAVLGTRFDSPGFYCLDEPEAALSFDSTLALMATLHDLVRGGGQAVCATHSPVLAAFPGARILELGPWGMREAAWDDLEVVQHWRSYLQSPQRYLRHLLD